MKQQGKWTSEEDAKLIQFVSRMYYVTRLITTVEPSLRWANNGRMSQRSLAEWQQIVVTGTAIT